MPILILFFYSSKGFSINHVDFEWETIEGAKSYQVEIKSNQSDIKRFKSKSPSFSLPLMPGHYEIQGRVVDEEQQFSPWSLWKSFDVPPSKVIITKQPEKINKIAANSYLSLIPVSWTAVEGANTYLIEVVDSQGKIINSISLKHTEWTLKLRPGLYSIQIRAKTSDGIESEVCTLPEPFLVQNIAVQPPSKITVELKRKRLSFEPAPGTNVNITLEMQKFLSDNWEVIAKKNEALDFFEWGSDIRPGKYKVTLLSQNAFGEVSVPITKEFLIKPEEQILPK